MKRFEFEEIWSWRDLELKRIEVEEIWSWKDLKLKGVKVEEIWSGRALKMKRFELEEILSWRDLKLKRFEVGEIWIWRDLKLKKSKFNYPSYSIGLRCEDLSRVHQSSLTALLLTGKSNFGKKVIFWMVWWTDERRSSE